MELKSADALTKDDLKEIKALHAGDPLPEGYFNSGRMYVSMDGTRSVAASLRIEAPHLGHL